MEIQFPQQMGWQVISWLYQSINSLSTRHTTSADVDPSPHPTPPACKHRKAEAPPPARRKTSESKVNINTSKEATK
eukprot:4758937-Pleurochrysis_carterae.AAC.1